MFDVLRRDSRKGAEQTQQGVRRSRESWFGRIAGLFRSPALDQGVWEELEEVLISADVGVKTSLGLVERLKAQARDQRQDQPDYLYTALKKELLSVLEMDGAGDPWSYPPEGVPSPYVVLMVGVNGSGKTTSAAKLAYHFREAGKKVVLGAADTFRAAASEQLQLLGAQVGAQVVSHAPGADPGAVAYDAFQATRARGADVLIIDTAGRLQTKSNLMEELKKIRRVLGRLDSSAPHQVVLTLDATTGHNGLSQARYFTEAVQCTGIFLAKLDGTAKGGIVMSINKELGLPILFIGTGEGLGDMAPFDSQQFVEALLAPAS